DLESLDEMVFERAAGFGAEALHALGGVVAGKRGEVHAGDGAEQPGGLPVLFDAAAGADGGGAALDGGGRAGCGGSGTARGREGRWGARGSRALRSQVC